ncbi:MAG TPA: ABATE domain-containing protein [Candidatus Acidoferrum sp.]|nr:ABATE domain-containing protein [Candidatus Acidoferrum sp.]
MKQVRAEQPASSDVAPLLADHPALDFLNTRPGIRTDDPVEHIGDGGALLTWLVTAGLLSRVEVGEVRRRFTRAQLDAAAAAARALRERLRPAVAAWQRSGGPPAATALAELNRLLAAGPTIAALHGVDGRTEMTRSHQFPTAAAMLAPVAEAFGQLFSEGDRQLVRECEAETCSLWFYDRTKAHRRRWCSMDLCGARAKAAAYRARKRDD